jgi:acyl-CoA synthetase (AMP-forming)/AMP-acid ligase II
LGFAQQHLAAYKLLEHITFLDVLPKGKTDRIDREKLRQNAIHENQSGS